MPHPDRNFSFAYRLPTDIASQIRNTTSPVAAVDHPRRRSFLSRILAIELAGGVGADRVRADENFHP